MSDYKILQAEKQGIYVLKFVGEIRLNLCSTLDRIIETMVGNPEFRTVVIDLTETRVVDSTTLGLLAKIAIAAKAKSDFLPTLITTHPDVTRIILSMGFERIFLILKDPLSAIDELEEIPELNATERQVHRQVLDAHKILMAMSDENAKEFRDLVHALECEEF